MTANLRPGSEISSLYAFGSAIYLFDKTCHFVPKPGTKHFVPVSCERLQKFHTGLSSSRSHVNTPLQTDAAPDFTRDLGPGRTSGQNCFCWDKISDKNLFPVKFILLCFGSHATWIPVIHASMCQQKKTFPRPLKVWNDNTLYQKVMEPRDAAFAFVGLVLLLTCMQARMANLYNLHCIYRLHNLNIQLALLEYERQIRQHRRRRRCNPYCWRLPRPNVSRFEIHFRNRAIPPDYFKSQLRMNRNTFNALLNMLHPFLLRQNTSLRVAFLQKSACSW